MASSYDAIYSAKYFLWDNNDQTSFYIGSFFGLQRVKATVEALSHTGPGQYSVPRSDHTRVQFPLGIRAGVKGGLDGFFGELFAQLGYAIGNGDLYTSEGVKAATSPVYFTVGVSFLGGGWDHRSDR